MRKDNATKQLFDLIWARNWKSIVDLMLRYTNLKEG